jgi:hypothetical protein
MDFIKLSCLDGTALMPEVLLNENIVLKNMIDDGVDINFTPVNFDLQDVVNYMNFCLIRQENEIVHDPLSDKIDIHEQSFLTSLEDKIVTPERKLDPIGNIIAISDFLNNAQVTDVCTKHFISSIEKLSSQDDIDFLRKIFNTTNDLTEVELEKIRNANLWCKYSNNSL